jgi:hypothetical protein
MIQFFPGNAVAHLLVIFIVYQFDIVNRDSLLYTSGARTFIICVEKNRNTNKNMQIFLLNVSKNIKTFVFPIQFYYEAFYIRKYFMEQRRHAMKKISKQIKIIKNMIKKVKFSM